MPPSSSFSENISVLQTVHMAPCSSFQQTLTHNTEHYYVQVHSDVEVWKKGHITLYTIKHLQLLFKLSAHKCPLIIPYWRFLTDFTPCRALPPKIPQPSPILSSLPTLQRATSPQPGLQEKINFLLLQVQPFGGFWLPELQSAFTPLGHIVVFPETKRAPFPRRILLLDFIPERHPQKMIRSSTLPPAGN